MWNVVLIEKHYVVRKAGSSSLLIPVTRPLATCELAPLHRWRNPSLRGKAAAHHTPSSRQACSRHGLHTSLLWGSGTLTGSPCAPSAPPEQEVNVEGRSQQESSKTVPDESNSKSGQGGKRWRVSRVFPFPPIHPLSARPLSRSAPFSVLSQL